MALSKGQLTRQKMINLMYLVFIAMLALNVSTEVLDGFVMINDNIQESIEVTDERNKQIYADINASYDSNPEKTKDSYDRAQAVKVKTDSIFGYLQHLKLEIAKKSDGADADIDNLKSKDNLDASSEVMLSPVGGHGKRLKEMLDRYREVMVAQIPDSAKRKIVMSTLSTEPSPRAKKENKSWITASFENMPSIAVITYLSELQVNVKQAEGEVLNDLAKNIDLKDIRVNELSAFVVPQSSMVMKGVPYRANIILAAVDTTQRPRIVVNGKELPTEKNGMYEAGTGAVGTFRFNGFIEMMDRSGMPVKRDFSQEYTVMEPMATVAPHWMDVLYAGVQNTLTITVPGVASQDVQATVVSGGTLRASGKDWVAVPSASMIGQKFVISVSAKVNGTQQFIARKELRIRPLPEPLPFIEYTDQNGSPKVFRKGALARSIILNTPGIKASIDDGILNIPFQVLSFRTMSIDAMGNTAPEMSNGASFSSRQLDQIRRMTRGTVFYISTIKAKGPDGVERDLYPMEIRIN
ncbi:gliding motility protein GldM [Dysgonomonas sp. 521]|uniref:type IX secretion system motor protein PorM/GldM n=1 Tax=Dysgonomonas sp. 521 TaxID=2302932 RepID=UPI0013D3E466|nr:gliding motility protein GldM [Dysgonomonas sp. 521]NDV94198.1 gliding motility protein GldM [Dysgonomonas sp. 521]